jgi:radical SAM superfamily enzyme YgiQ (UPF0313 family)
MGNYRIVFIRVFDFLPNGIIPPLGIGSLIAYIKSRTGEFTFDVYDAAISNKVFSDIDREYKEREPFIFAISSMLKHYRELKKLVGQLKTKFPSVPIVVGGPLISSLKERVLNIKEIDYAIYGEGEIPFYLLCSKMIKGEGLRDIPALIYRDGVNIEINPPEGTTLREDEIPIPDYEEIGLEKYFEYPGFEIIGVRPYLPIITSRGCPYSCTYCHGIFGRRVRKIPVDRIVETVIKFTTKYNIKDIEVLDDIFNIDEDRAKEIITRILNHNRNIQFLYPNGFRTDILSKDFIDFLGSNNTKYISIAVETASERIQRLIKKNLDLNRVRENAIMLSKYDIVLNGYFMIGFPTETREEILKTIRYARTLPLHMASFFRVAPHCGTELFDILPDETKQRIMDMLDDVRYYSDAINISSVPSSTLNMLHKYAVASFYLDPGRILKIVRDIPAKTVFTQGMTTFLRILSGRYKE